MIPLLQGRGYSQKGIPRTLQWESEMQSSREGSAEKHALGPKPPAEQHELD